MDLEFNELTNDLQILFKESEILLENIPEISSQLKSPEAQKYLHDLMEGSKPETALREAFFAGTTAKILNRLGNESNPESKLPDGFIDYKIGKGRKTILLELKPLFEIHNITNNGKSTPKSIHTKSLNWEAHKDQILKYMRQSGEFIILTNLKEWVFFNDMIDPENPQPFLTLSFEDFFNGLQKSTNLQEFLKRRDSESNREVLDKQFFESLKMWINLLEKLEFKGNAEEKRRKIIGVVNKFIFVQTLDDYEVIEFNWIFETWEHIEKRWDQKGPQEKLKKFFEEVNTWFYEYYDTELFTTSIVDVLKDDESNFKKFYFALKSVLGISYVETPSRSLKGIIQYNFTYINEDIFGKAYEQYLANVRHDEAIYYTPHYVTEHICEITISSLFDQKIEMMKNSIENKNYDDTKKFIDEFLTIKILDPACGSGSFLVKSFKKIFEKYKAIDEFLVNKQKELAIGEARYTSQDLFNILEEFRLKLKTKEKRILIPSILLRHIHGNDLDKSALNVAKVNLWLEAIKSSPRDFKYTNLGASNRILPYLEMNLVSGNALIGLDDKTVIEFLLQNEKDSLKKLFKLRECYMLDPTDPELIKEIEEIQEKIHPNLDKLLLEKLKTLSIPDELLKDTKSLYWPLAFFHMFFNGDVELSDELKGANCLVGNPPYLDSETMTKKIPLQRDFCNDAYVSSSGNWDIYCVFIEKGLNLTKQNGVFGYIIPNKLLSSPYADKLCDHIRNFNVTSLRDYSTVKVFDAAVYPIVITISKTKVDKKSEILIESMEENGIFPHVTTNRTILQSDLHSLENNLWGSIFGTQSSIDLHSLVYSKFDKIKEIQNLSIKGAATVSEAYEIKKIVREQTDDDQNFKKFINTGTIDPFTSLWGISTTQYIKSQFHQPVVSDNDLQNLYPQRFTDSITSKIIIASMCKEYEAFYDSAGNYLAGKSTAIITSDKFNLKSLNAFLNSCIPTFLAKSHPGLELSNGYLNINKSLIEDLPVPDDVLIDKNEENRLVQLADELSLLTIDKYEFKKCWVNWCQKLSIKDLDLLTLLDYDHSEISQNKPQNTFTHDVSVYPSTGIDVFSNKHESFNLEGDVITFRILITMDTRESFYMDFKDLESMLHVFSCLLKTKNSGKRYTNLTELFEKTLIPIINPNYWFNTKNIMLKTLEEFSNLKNKNTPNNLIQINNRINEIISEIDFICINLFEISDTSQIEFILNSTERNNIQKNLVMHRFENPGIEIQ